MTTTGATLLDLLPVLYRLRDEDVASGLSGRLTAAERTELADLEQKGGAADQTDSVRREQLRAKATRGPLGAFWN